MMNLSVDTLSPLVLSAGFAVHNGDWNWRDVTSPFNRLYYVTEGSAQVELPSGRYRLAPDHMYFIPAFTRHNNICDTHFCHYYLHIYEDNRHADCLLDKWAFPVEIPGTELDLALIRRFCEINPHKSLSQSDPTTYDNSQTLRQSILNDKQTAFPDKVESRGIVYQLLSRFLARAQEKNGNGDERVEKALSYIHDHLYETIDLNVLAERISLSKDHFIRLFKQEVKTTPRQYINRKKIEKAQLMLVTSGLSVKDIAFTLGFEDDSYFHRLFRNLTGTTPQEYRCSFH